MKIRLGTFNLFQFVQPPYSWYTKDEKFNHDEWLQKTKWIKNQIKSMNCDLIGFQEVFSKDALKDLVGDLGYKYFETVDEAKLSNIDKDTYISTTVAIASKYPITNIQEVKVDILSIKKHNFEGSFKFSRTPIKTSVMLPNEKEVLVYICHLKSNRLNEFEYTFNNEHTLKQKKDLIVQDLNNSGITSIKQRLCEASTLFYDIKQNNSKPYVLMCDLNDKEFSLTIDALANNKYHDDFSCEDLLLYDASYEYKEIPYNPHPEQKELKRKATCYFEGKGNVLDYIFISNHFLKTNKNKIAYVSDYKVFDTHLKENQNGSILKSDHAQVVCELTFS